MTTSVSQPPAATLRAHVSILDAATRLQHFRSMIAEMRATLLRYDLEEEDQGFRAGNGDNDDGDDDDDRERERVLRLLEDVTRKVKCLADKDATSLGRHPVAIAEVEYDNSLGLYPTSTVSCFAGEKRQVFPSYYPLTTERPQLVNHELCL